MLYPPNVRLYTTDLIVFDALIWPGHAVVPLIGKLPVSYLGFAVAHGTFFSSLWLVKS